ncbi:YdiY family protein [Oceanicoccus sp. KOV_DT_Chl]|uniref:DUF481 domain-containing protein n=1 Tax=Oceanicoccus sp. KOV_DT_Chl TaxID=1904639 RepID=UPI000C7C22B3|nr:DUF481 domain-containing protein [Oceanicoccus sp. KOV_DT_Chl]
MNNLYRHLLAFIFVLFFATSANSQSNNDSSTADAESATADPAIRAEALSKQIEALTQELNDITRAQPESTAAAQTAIDIATADTKIWSGDIELGFFEATGNTVEKTSKSGINVSREKQQWRYNLVFDSLNTEKDGERSAEKYFLANRLAYQYNEFDYSFGYISYDDDRFSGFDYQTTISAGYGRRIINNDTMHWDAEIGPGYRISKVDENSTDEDLDETILRLYSVYKWGFTDNAEFNQSINIETGEENTISKSVTSLRIQMIGQLSVKLAYSIKYSEEVPVDTNHADTETTVTISYSF